jgi:ABC-type glutathione transport system ATPase component
VACGAFTALIFLNFLCAIVGFSGTLLATSALDTLTENSVQEALDRLGQHRSVLVIAHRLGTIRNADNIIVLKDGMVAEQGTHDQLLSKPGGVYAEMWNMQLHSTSASGSTASLTGL